MELKGQRILLTGAAGGIGSALAERLAAKGARLALLGRSRARLVPVMERLSGDVTVFAVEADLRDPGQLADAVAQVQRQYGGVDVLINCAAQVSFRSLAEEDPRTLSAIVDTNLTAPMLLVRQLLPAMLDAGAGRIVNVGSTFGSIGFAWFSAYSASKFGLRGFSEALRRELDGTGVGVTYVAPRAVKTPFNSDAVYRMAAETGMKMDEPDWVAARIVAAIEADARDVYLGFPEKLFARLNGLLPRLIDGGLRRQNRLSARFAREA